jgi:hypothetical protein
MAASRGCAMSALHYAKVSLQTVVQGHECLGCHHHPARLRSAALAAADSATICFVSK